MHERWRGRGCMNGSLQLRFALSTHTRRKRHTHTFTFITNARTCPPKKPSLSPEATSLGAAGSYEVQEGRRTYLGASVCVLRACLALCGFCGSVAFCGPLDCPPCGPWSSWKEMFPLLPSSPSKPHAIPCPTIPLSDLVYPRRLLP